MAVEERQAATAEEIAFAVLNVICMIFVVSSNTLVLVLIFRTKSLKVPGNYQIISLCCANLAAGLLGVPSTILSQLTNYDRGAFCKVHQYFLHLVDMAEVYSLVAIAWDSCRMIITLSNTKKTARRAITDVVLIWVSSVIYAIRAPFLFDQVDISHGNSTEHKLSICGPMGIGHGRTIQIISDLFFVLDFLLLFVMPVVLISILYLIIVAKSKQKPDLQVKGRSRRLRVFLTASLIVIIFVICTLPLYSLELYVNVGPGPFPSEHTLLNSFELLSFFNFGLNPIVYALSRMHFRIALRRMLKISNSVSPFDRRNRTIVLTRTVVTGISQSDYY